MPSLAEPLIMKASVETQSTRAWRRRAVAPRVMHVFERAANLVDDRAGVLSLVGHPAGAGPFTIVLSPARPDDGARIRFDDWLDQDSPVRVEAGDITAGRLHILGGGGEVWDAALPWQTLRAQEDRVLASREQLLDLLRRAAPPGGLSQLYSERPAEGEGSGGMLDAMLERARRPARSLVQSLAAGERDAAVEAAAQLAGLGGGLTPSGDDFIVGTMYAIRLLGELDWAAATARRLAETAGPKTVPISAAWLEAAGRGEASLAWHRLCAAVLTVDPQAIDAAARQLLAVGHTSGADALTGFLMGVDAFAPD
jgi:hypothetical protein